jgi:DNA-binding CsgD family transcriptional regulator
VLSAVAASAQASGPARARVCTPTGQWLVLHGARLDGDPQARVSVIIEPPRPDDLAPLLVAAYGLSDREQAVTALVFQGRSTRQIARALQISPYTVQEHLTSSSTRSGSAAVGNWSARSSSATTCQQSPNDQPAQATNALRLPEGVSGQAGSSGRFSPQLTAFFTSAPILASSAAVSSVSAKAVGHMAPSSRFAVSLKPNVAYLVLNFCAGWKKQTTLPSLAYAGIP